MDRKTDIMAVMITAVVGMVVVLLILAIASGLLSCSGNQRLPSAEERKLACTAIEMLPRDSGVPFNDALLAVFRADCMRWRESLSATDASVDAE